MYIVRDGKVVWTLLDSRQGGTRDCTMLRTETSFFSRRFGASEVTPDKKIVWDYAGAPNTEIHTTYPMGKQSRANHAERKSRQAVVIRQSGPSDPRKN